MPDVIINWDPGAKVTTTVEIEGLGVIESPEAGYEVSPYYTGNHRGNAFVITGRAGTTHPAEFVDGSILDLAPTILDYFNIAIPSHMDGRSRFELLDGPAGTE